MMAKVNPGGKKEDKEEMEEENSTKNISAKESTDISLIFSEIDFFLVCKVYINCI